MAHIRREIWVKVIYASATMAPAAISVLLWFWHQKPPIETAQVAADREAYLHQQQVEAESRQYYVQRQQQLAAATAERRDGICKIRMMCLNYGKSRQECAMAGNFDLCMSVKLGSQTPLRHECNDDGTMSAPPQNMPNLVECVVVTIGDYFK